MPKKKSSASNEEKTLKLLNAKEAEALASLPSKEEIYAKMLGCVNSPATGIVGSINAVMSSLVRAIDAVREKKSA